MERGGNHKSGVIQLNHYPRRTSLVHHWPRPRPAADLFLRFHNASRLGRFAHQLDSLFYRYHPLPAQWLHNLSGCDNGYTISRRKKSLLSKHESKRNSCTEYRLTFSYRTKHWCQWKSWENGDGGEMVIPRSGLEPSLYHIYQPNTPFVIFL